MARKSNNPSLTREDLKEVLSEFASAYNFATRDDLKGFATKDDLKAFATKEDLESFATKEDLKAFATREDLNAFATKEDLMAFETRYEFDTFVTRDDMEKSFDKFAEMVGRGFSHVQGQIHDLNESLNSFKSDTERSLHILDSKVFEIDKRLDRVEASFEPIPAILKASEGWMQNHESRISKLETITLS